MQKLSISLLLLTVVFSFAPVSLQALTYDEIRQSQNGKILGETSALYPYPSGSLVNENGTIYFISGVSKIPFTNWSAFVGLGYSLRNVVNGSLQNYTPAATYFITTANAPHPWGSWLLYNGTIYYSHQTGLIGVPTWEVFLQNGGKLAYVVKANSYDINVLNTNPNISVLATNDLRIYSQPSSVSQTPVQSQPTITPTPAYPSPTTPTNYLQKQTLVFSIDQTWLNGIVNVRDTVSLQRIINTLKQFQTKYEVYALLNPSNADQSKVFAVLDTLTANGIPFVLDQYSSDTHKDTVNNPYDPYHGLALSPNQLTAYKQKYGSSFAGIRFMEVFGANFTVLACKLQGVDWCKYFKDQLPTDNFYQKSIAETYIKFASDNKMFVLWSDFYWSFFNNWEFDQNTVKQPQNEQEMKDLMAKYPGVIVAVFDNNLPEDGARKNNLINTWFSNFKPFIQNGAKGFGLSDQNWMCNKDTSGCPAQEISDWATTAFANGASVVQFEPVWYFWNLPEGTIDQWVVAGQNPTGYTQESAWSNRGYVRNNVVVVGNALGVNVSTEQVVQQNSSVCVSVNVPDTLNIGQSFTGTVTVQNSGNTTWTQVSSSNPNPYRLGANDFAQPPYTSSIWGSPKIELPISSVLPGQQTTFTINSKAPTTTGSYDFAWKMLHDYKEWFGPVCSKTVKVIDPNAVPLKNLAACVNITVPDSVKPGQAFTATVTMKNTGTKPWVSANQQTSWQVYHLGALDFQQPPYTTSKWGKTDYLLQDKTTVNPGEQTTFTLTPTAPSNEGTYDFGWQMYEHGVEWFGDTCIKPVKVTNTPPPPTNAAAVCPAPGSNATISWTAPSGYNTFFVRVKKWPHPADGSAIYWSDNYTGTNYSFSSVSGQAYNWWIHTKDPATGNFSEAVGTTFTCPIP